MIGVNVSHTKLIHKLFEVPMGEVTLKGPFSAHFVRKTFLSERVTKTELPAQCRGCTQDTGLGFFPSNNYFNFTFRKTSSF